VAQGVGPEFKLQYCQKKKKKIKGILLVFLCRQKSPMVEMSSLGQEEDIPVRLRGFRFHCFL
jgi:hypothetical protein